MYRDSFKAIEAYYRYQRYQDAMAFLSALGTALFLFAPWGHVSEIIRSSIVQLLFYPLG